MIRYHLCKTELQAPASTPEGRRRWVVDNPIIVDSEGVIVAGHTRYKAAQKLGLQTVPCLVADDLTQEQINAFRLVDNKSGELAEWDFDALKVELDNIGEIDLSDMGFDLTLHDDYTEPDIEDFGNSTAGGKVETCHCPKCGFEWVK